jgi:Predicted membrane protein
MVLALPLLIGPLALSHYQYGVVAGLTVYAVPQVLAATLPVSDLSGQVGTLVKLTRVLMLGPIVLGVSLALRRRGAAPGATVRLGRLVPWFIIGFLICAAVRATGIVPAEVVNVARTASGYLTIVAMAALGLGVDVRAVGRVGGAVMATALGALAILLAISVGLVKGAGIG